MRFDVTFCFFHSPEVTMPHGNKNKAFKSQAANPMKLLTEELIQFKEVPPLLQDRVHVSTVWRWATRGLKNCKLETVSIGGKRVTSVQAVNRFLEKTSSR
ncbi:hypothetical protein RISK_005313 [Rhodopirellula islandica]|uniref:Protein containing DUF1580 n=1 Tax=Rhodopirellula islandica TaxID=595434 RepID=A0A0J1B676_RHOIS|nr:DUF1580 domain-containing protein [Rhodopirellula islandica]KLU02247.1 hypothetical protein RISK_005313 [Rhodopirellula islandica]